MTQKLINDIMDYTNNNMDENTLYFLTGKFFTTEDVIKNNEKYNKEYSHIYKSNGFNDFYDMFLFCHSNTDKVSKGGDKDLSNLNKVKRKVIRNGKEVEMTIYEDGNKDNESMDKDTQKETEQNYSALGSSEEENGNLNEKVNPEKLANTLGKLKSQGVDTSNINENGQMFKDFNNGGSLLGIAEYSYTEDTIRLESYASSKESIGVGIRAVVELIKLGIVYDKNIEVYDIQLKEAETYLEYLGFVKFKNGYRMKKNDVREVVGDLHDFI